MRPRRSCPIAAMAMFAGTAIATAAWSQTPPGTLPSPETVRSLLLNNWVDTLAIHYSRQLYRSDSRLFGPYLSALHYRADWPVNVIDGATALFRAEVIDGGSFTNTDRPPALCESTGEVRGDDAPADPGIRHSYPSIMCFNDGGILNVEYLRETERGLPIQIEKSYAMVPNRRFLVVRYTLTNNIPPEENRTIRARFAELVDLNNKAALDHEESAEDLIDTGINEPQPGQAINSIQAQWNADLNAWIADMSAVNGTFLVFGAFQEMDRHRAFQTVSDQIEFDRAIESEMNAFDRPEWPEDMDALAAWDVGLALWKEVVLEPGAHQQQSFFYAVTSSLDEARTIIQEARAPATPDAWFEETANAYQTWLSNSVPLETADAGLRHAFTRALVTNKQAQHPEFGSFVATTNPAYGFKVWPRDSSVTALGFTAAGHLAEAVKYYRWMAAVQEDGTSENYPAGTWYSNYSYWIRKFPKTFVEPEWDSLGLFMIGVYHTWRRLDERDPQAARDFLTGPIEKLDQGPASVYEAVRRSAEYISSTINEHNFGPGDHSIWEEQFQWATFTQTTYASGLNAAHLLAEQMGENDRAAAWLDGARRILEAIHRTASAAPCPGLWNDDQSHWNRAANIDCARDDRLDAAADLVWVFGLIDAADDRARAQRDAVLSRLTPGNDDIGIARYEGDEFYFQSSVSPGGPFEASAQLPSWPQMDMYMSMLEHWRGLDDLSLQRLQWYARATNVGYIPPGEGVDWPTDRPLPSTAAEPVTAAWYILALLNYHGQFDPRLPPL